MHGQTKKHYLNAIFYLVLGIYLTSIVFINFSRNPGYYPTDMYSDMTYAMEVWKHKSIFPEGWVFGNQLYVIATPVLSALFYGLLHDPCIAMGMASAVMTFGVLVSFNYMLKPVVKSVCERLMGMVVFMTIMLVCNDPIYSCSGWQLLFTLCSYYACYAITIFLSFGCYMRSNSQWSPKYIGALLLSCALSFGTGIQSLRQTLIMVCPLVAVEILKILYHIVYRKKFTGKSWLAVVCIFVSNLAGVLFAKALDVTQVEIFGDIGITRLSAALSSVIPSLLTLFSLALPENKLLVLIVAILFLIVFVYVFYKLAIAKSYRAIIYLLLFSISVSAVLFLDIFTTMFIREIYYFLFYPLLTLVFVFLYSYLGKAMRYLSVVCLLIICVFSCSKRLLPIYSPQRSTIYEEVADYLEEQDITTIFSAWNQGEKISIASNWTINAAFWDSVNRPFISVNYLCNPAVFDVDPSCSAYIFFGKEATDIAVEKANSRNVDFTLQKCFEDNDIYVYTSTQPIMYVLSEN